MKWKYKNIKSTEGNTFLRRLSFYLKKGSIKLHLITGNDSLEYHTHPWDFTSLILFGGYREHTIVTEIQCQASFSVRYQKPYRMFSINKKLHNQRHRVELFKLFGISIPAVTIEVYSEKLKLCSFCKEAGYCKSNK